MKFFGYWVILAYAGTHYFLPELYSPPTSAGAHGGPLYMVSTQQHAPAFTRYTHAAEVPLPATLVFLADPHLPSPHSAGAPSV